MTAKRQTARQQHSERKGQQKLSTQRRDYPQNRQQIYKNHLMAIMSMEKEKRFTYQRMTPTKQENPNLPISLPRISKTTLEQEIPKDCSRLLKDNTSSLSIPLKPVPHRKISSKNKFGWTVQKKDIQLREQLVVNKSNQSYCVASQKYKNEWTNTLKQLQMQFESASHKITILPRSFWPYLISKFKKFYLHVDQKIELLQLFSKFFQYTLQPQKNTSQFDFCSQMGSKLQKMQNRIYFQHKYCLQYAKFMIAQNIHKEKFYSRHFFEFNFNFHQKEVHELFVIVRHFCQNNMDAFAFITLYFQISLKKRLKNVSFKEVESQFVKLIEQLSKRYPPSLQPNEQIFNSFGLQNILLNYQFQVLTFTKGKKSHFQQLKEKIIQKIQQAKEQQTLFRQLVEDICFKYGYGFKVGVKIKSAQSKASIFRTIEKLLSKNKFKDAFSLLKKKLNESNSETQKFSQKRIMREIEKGEAEITEILQKQTFIQIDSKDLVRGKCTFSKIEEIILTVKMLKEQIEKAGFQIIELKNRLRKGTKDVSLIIKLPKSIAQLQLALKLDSVSNEFNHKIFELARSQIFSPITNLFVHNERWCQTFFTDQFELFEEIVNMNRQPDLKDEITFKRLKKDVTMFKKVFLETNGIKYEKNYRTKQEQKRKIHSKLKEIKIFNSQILFLNTNQIQIRYSQTENQINFYKTFDYEKALETIETIEQKQLESNLRLMKLKADIMKHHGKYKQSLEFYEKYQKYHKQSNQTNLQLADVLQSIGLIHDIRQQYHQAIEYYQKSLEIKEQINGKQTIEVAASLSGIGEVYSNMKTKENYSNALNYHTNALNITQKILGKQSIDVATALNNIGVVYRRDGDYQNSLDFLKQSLEIRQKILGKQSLDAATSLYNIGIVYRFKKNGNKSLEYLNKAIEIKEKILGQESLDVAKIYLELSYVFEQLQELQKAQNSISVAYFIFRKILGQEHGKTKLSYEQYKDVRSKLERRLKATFYSSTLYKAINQDQQNGSFKNHK